MADKLSTWCEYSKVTIPFYLTVSQLVDNLQNVIMASALGIEAKKTLQGRAVLVRRGPYNAHIDTGAYLKMLWMAIGTPTCVVILIVVPQMDLGVIPLILLLDGNTATCLGVLQEVGSVI